VTRSWLITSTTYGTWLPGDRRGFVGTVRDRRPDDADAPGRIRHNALDTEYDRNMPGLRASAERLMKCAPVLLSVDQAGVVLDQFRSTAGHRGWDLRAAAVMANHFHIVVTAPEAVPAAHLLRDFKSYAARALNRRWPTPGSGTWWTESGSRRPLPNERAVEDAVAYVRAQHARLAMWVAGMESPERGASAP
jgi:REP element-mobilizing transposase RayT